MEAESTISNETIKTEWKTLQSYILKNFEKKNADLNAVLFLIGIQELGKGFINFSKEQKQDLMHIAICKVLSKEGYYEFEKIDEDGWSHWKLTKPLPAFDILAQENFLKHHVLEYFKDEGIL